MQYKHNDYEHNGSVPNPSVLPTEAAFKGQVRYLTLKALF